MLYVWVNALYMKVAMSNRAGLTVMEFVFVANGTGVLFVIVLM